MTDATTLMLPVLAPTPPTGPFRVIYGRSSLSLGPPPIPPPGSVPYESPGLTGVELACAWVKALRPRSWDGPSQGDLHLCVLATEAGPKLTHLRHDGHCWRVMPLAWSPPEPPKGYDADRQAYLDFLVESGVEVAP